MICIYSDNIGHYQNMNVFKILIQNLFGKLLGDKGYISATQLFYELDCCSPSILFL
jgi:hypothetical protein